ncbi:maleylpyruvate isomerase family mycothiol-dependent enzyme, partial [Aldersonia sp. NBC_00410]|uniref:maleylpyruvate isomerase family mycothiol-dependent enzyme n=1 Tax=Aldersonia sp. NBC_00410 TaxID=2975954 RepID=UPI00225A31C6
MSLARSERIALVATMTEVGPDAPTLCDGWTARDLAAHLITRERRPDTGPGILIPAFAGYTDKVRRKAAEQPWTELLDRPARSTIGRRCDAQFGGGTSGVFVVIHGGACRGAAPTRTCTRSRRRYDLWSCRGWRRRLQARSRWCWSR